MKYRGIEQLEQRRLLSVNGSSSPDSFVSFNNATYFSATDGIHGRELWETDGTDPGTHRVDLGLPQGTSILQLKVLGDRIVIHGEWDDNATGLWVTDGTPQGTQKMFDHVPIDNSFARLGNDIYFVSKYGVGENYLFKFNLTSGVTVQVAGLLPDGITPFPWHMGGIVGVAGGSVFYTRWGTGNLGITSDKLYAIGGSLSAETAISNLGADDPPYVYTAAGDGVIYVVSSGDVEKISGPAITEESGPLVDSNSFPQVDSVSSSPASDGTLYFVASVGGNYALWNSDGTKQGTHKIAALPGKPTNLETAGTQAFFTIGKELWTSDGAAGGTHKLTDLDNGLTDAAAVDGKYVFLDNTFLFNGTAVSHLWETDGTAAGTEEIALPSGVSTTSISASDDHVYFPGHEGQHGSELWTVDTVQPTVLLLKDINTQSIAPPTGISVQASSADPSGPGWITNVGDPAFTLTTDEDAHGIVLYIDGQETLRREPVPTNQPIQVTGLSEGAHTVTAASIAADDTLSPQTAPYKLTLDYHGPTLTSLQFDYAPGHVGRFTLTGSEPVHLFETSGLPKTQYVLTNLDNPAAKWKIELTEAPAGADPNTAVYAISKFVNGWLQNGHYRLTLHSYDVKDVAGNSMTKDVSVDFTYVNVGQNAPVPPVLSKGVLTVNGTNTLDAIVVSLASDPSKLQVDLNGQVTTYPLANVSSLVVNGLAGNDLIRCSALPAGLPLTIKLYGGDGNDVVYGSAGNDFISGGHGNDTLVGGNGNDTLWGDDGTDSISGGAGKNTIVNADVAVAAPEGVAVENHVLNVMGTAASDRITIRRNATNSELIDVVLNGHLRNFTLSDVKQIYVNSGNGNDYLNLKGLTITSTLLSGRGNDSIYGTNAADSINGGAGNDLLFGYTGNDSIVGGDGIDSIRGGVGADRLIEHVGLDSIDKDKKDLIINDTV